MTETNPQEPASGPIQIDLQAVIDRRGARVPRWLVRRLARLIRQDSLNALLRYAYPRRGADFCDAVLEHLDVHLDVRGAERLPADGRVVIVSNHPLGGLDGMALISYFAKVYGPRLHFIVNDLLMAVEPLSDVFVPVNKHGAQSRDAMTAVEDAFASPDPVIIFPAGLCSRRRKGVVADLQWQKMFVRMARRTGRDVVPVHFMAQNSSRFYRIASLRERTGLKFNAEMVLLPGEIFRQAGRTFTAVIGDTISLPAPGADAPADVVLAEAIRQTVYSLNPFNTPIARQ